MDQLRSLNGSSSSGVNRVQALRGLTSDEESNRRSLILNCKSFNPPEEHYLSATPFDNSSYARSSNNRPLRSSINRPLSPDSV